MRSCNNNNMLAKLKLTSMGLNFRIAIEQGFYITLNKMYTVAVYITQETASHGLLNYPHVHMHVTITTDGLLRHTHGYLNIASR